jgi:hypothetical protein
MKGKDVFGIILRGMALWIIVWGAWQITGAIAVLPATLASFLAPSDLRIGSLGYLSYGLPALIGGILVLRFANAIVWFTYRE